MKGWLIFRVRLAGLRFRCRLTCRGWKTSKGGICNRSRSRLNGKEGRMTGVKQAVAFLILALAASTTESAQMGMGMRAGPPQIRGVWSPVVGQGALYQISPQTGKKTEMEITVLGKEPVEGKDGYWMQMAMSSSETGGQMVMKHLFVLDGQETRTARMIMQMPGQPPMEMPAQMMHRGRSTQEADVRNDAQDLGSESITVPAGTYTTEHY